MSPLPRRSPLLLGTLLLGTLLLGTLLSLTAQAQQAEPQPSRVQVQAQSTLEVAPDEATLSARLWERTPAIVAGEDSRTDPDALREARERLESRTGELIRALEAAGLERDAISAGSLQIRPDHVPGPTRSDGQRETLVRTQLERPVTLRLEDIERVPVILDALTEAGVNALDGVRYDLADRDGATDEALVQALQKARHKAELMAETLGFELGEVAHIEETQAPVYAPRMMAMRAADSMESQGASPEYRPGTISIDAEVRVSWDIQQQGGFTLEGGEQ